MNEGLFILNSLKDCHQEKLRAISNLIQYHSQRGEFRAAEDFVHKGRVLLKDSPPDDYSAFFLFAWSL